VTLDDVMADLQAHGSESTKKVLVKHGAREPFFGVKVDHLKTIVKKVKRDHALALALALYDTGNSDAMYLASYLSDPAAFTKAQLNKWAKGAYWHYLSCFAVPWAAAESRFGRELALEWMGSKKEQIAAAGWSTYSSLLSIQPDEELDHAEITDLLARVVRDIHAAPNRAKAAMNNFVIAVGTYVPALTAKAKATAKAVGTVDVDVGDTSCKVPDAGVSIDKVIASGWHGKKRKSVRC
jgi:3-methyladenine DNA glycosylase AlkD